MVHVALLLVHNLFTQDSFTALTLVLKWHNLSPPLGIFCINVCCEMFYADTTFYFNAKE